ncbi:MAG: DNA gyrase inhibitor YacG [Myxococcota bacterium]
MRARRCPICGEPAATPGSEEFPFCSKRCRLVDLGNWLGEGYRVPERSVPASPDESDWNEGMG